jgi:hypothetical protein
MKFPLISKIIIKFNDNVFSTLSLSYINEFKGLKILRVSHFSPFYPPSSLIRRTLRPLVSIFTLLHFKNPRREWGGERKREKRRRRKVNVEVALERGNALPYLVSTTPSSIFFPSCFMLLAL